MGNSGSKPSSGKKSSASDRSVKKKYTPSKKTSSSSSSKSPVSSGRAQSTSSKSTASDNVSKDTLTHFEKVEKPETPNPGADKISDSLPLINVTEDAILATSDSKKAKAHIPSSGKSVSSMSTKNSNKEKSSSDTTDENKKLHHKRGHSLGYIPMQEVTSNEATTDSNQISRHLQVSGTNSSLHTASNNRRLPLSRRSSHTSNSDLPPSMVQLEPKSPILKGYSKSIHGNSTHSLSYQKSETGQNYDNEPSTGHESNMKLHRSGSFASSLHSGNATVYNTPLTSPGIESHGGSEDYFNKSHEPSNSGPDYHLHSSKSNKDIFDNTVNLIKHTYKDSFPKSLPFEDVFEENFEKDLNDDRSLAMKRKKPLKPINIDETIQKLLDAGYAAKRAKTVCLKNSEIAQICQLSREIFLSQPSLLELSAPVKIVGDVHGQYGDLLRLFTKCGFPPAANYLFLGDYVDRGKQSLETILLLLCYKIKYPENFFLLRGNHECANVTRVYGFYDECKRRCNIKTWKVFVDTFNTLPLAAIVTGKIFCVHGGLSPVLNSMDEIRHFSRPTDVPDFGLINDLLWSDPTDSPNEWEDNERGVSYCYNKVAINKFLNKFGFDLVCRAHMVVEDGYEFFNDRSLVTVFSAPNYCGEFDNWGAVMTVSEGLLCSFELLDPLDRAALKQVMKKGRQERKLANHQTLLEY
ncbi:hypothetical protein TPHA_0K00420 [Tetrapisispora phaffii CBS 4417]|uniref:Serine/threonine-protein phosphatase n=1 Tax=Tetrapisispora phaffii (strain ATCC 24235 / CBS 4417 / NBRC 1672 / NRRL Y-8282 / UCD 70-5) TaxID=1071381 RepID=G8BZ48_TETPH|nr:hypothetical protein TPHA_0K00420 [Tetrapisispora phaffii CBS 4417]CCE65176.1 hypothetical protein TPHA_0K00420 [Tetrapisispora phaffii CBS 4417]